MEVLTIDSVVVVIFFFCFLRNQRFVSPCSLLWLDNMNNVGSYVECLLYFFCYFYAVSNSSRDLSWWGIQLPPRATCFS